MTIDQLEESLLARGPQEAKARAKWEKAVERLAAAAKAPASFDELMSNLPPKAKYIGPGPWMDAIKDSYRP